MIPIETLYYIFVVQFALPIMTVSGQDGHLFCPTNVVWYTGDPIQLVCEVSKQSITNLCVTTQDETEFRVTPNTASSWPCTVNSTGYANCLSSDPVTPPGTCWCQENSTDYKFVYQVTATKGALDGSWTCHKGCFDSSTFRNPLQITADSSCTNIVVMDRPTTAPSATATTTPSATATTTTPSTNRTQTTTQPPPPPCWCRICNPNNCSITCQGICIALIVIGVILCVGAAVVIWLFVCEKKRRLFIDPGGKLDHAQMTQCAQLMIDMKSDGYGTKLKSIAKQASDVCTCCPVSILVDGQYSINKTDGIQIMEHDKALHVLVTCRNYFYLRRAVKMIKALIKKLTKDTDGSVAYETVAI